ncbi:MAG: hypothetical protein HYS04_21010 [Acidobacteria bacterium]|nr:hypothetical protein [Acidobacteriota bacterium]
MHMRLVGSARSPDVEGLEPLGSYSNYFAGRTEKEWFTGIPHYGKVRYRNVYSGIHLVYYAKGRNLEYDFIVSPGADPSRTELAFSEPVKLDGGDVVVAGLRTRRPRVLQEGRELHAGYRITRENSVQLAMTIDDRTTPRVDRPCAGVRLVPVGDRATTR